MADHRAASWFAHTRRPIVKRRGSCSGSPMAHPTPSRRGLRTAWALTALTAFSTGVFLAPCAVADAATNLRDAVASARSGASCGPLQYNDVVGHVADIINKSTDDYLDQTATRVPISDPLQGLKDLGYGGSKAYLLQGANESDAIAIKAALLEGDDAIPDCSYTNFGVSMRRNDATGYALAVVVLARP